MLPVLETAAGEEDWEVASRVAAGVAEIAAEEDGRAVEEVGVVFLRSVELCEEIAQRLHRLDLDNLELLELARILAVVREIVVAEVDPFDRWCCGRASEHDGDEAGRVGLQREMGEIEKQARATDQVGRVGNVLRRSGVDFGLRPLSPVAIADHLLFQLTDAGEVFIHLVAVFRAKMGVQRFGLLTNVVENAAPVFEMAHLLTFLRSRAFEEQPRENSGWRIIRRDQRARPGPTEPTCPVARQGETRESRLRTDVASGELVERDRVAESGPARAWDTGEKTR